MQQPIEQQASPDKVEELRQRLIEVANAMQALEEVCTTIGDLVTRIAEGLKLAESECKHGGRLRKKTKR